eukprot:2412739-Rhodomonas_salina.4
MYAPSTTVTVTTRNGTEQYWLVPGTEASAYPRHRIQFAGTSDSPCRTNTLSASESWVFEFTQWRGNGTGTTRTPVAPGRGLTEIYPERPSVVSARCVLEPSSVSSQRLAATALLTVPGYP